MVSLVLESVPETYADGACRLLPTSPLQGRRVSRSRDDDQPVDTTPPVVQLSVTDGQVVPLGFVATCTASDDQSGVDGPCVVTTSGPGPGEVVVTGTARDIAGNVGSAFGERRGHGAASSDLGAETPARPRSGEQVLEPRWPVPVPGERRDLSDDLPPAPRPGEDDDVGRPSLRSRRAAGCGHGPQGQRVRGHRVARRAPRSAPPGAVGGTLKVEATSATVIVLEARQGGAVVATTVYRLATLARQGTGALGDNWALPMPSAPADTWRISASSGRFALVGGADGSGDTTVSLAG